MNLAEVPFARVLGAYQPRPLAETPRSAAVVLVLLSRPGGEPALLMTRRHSAMRSYADDWCLPGGRRESRDASLLACAWRELREETGLDPSSCRLLAALDDFMTAGERWSDLSYASFLKPV